MRNPTLTIVLVALLVAPALAEGQDRRIAPTADAPRVEIPDGEIEPIARAIRAGEPESRIESRWTSLLERHADGMEEKDAGALTVRVLHAAWKPMASDLDDGIRDLEESGACPDEARAVDRHRDTLERELAAGGDATAADVETAAASFAALAEALGACEERITATPAATPRAIQPPAGGRAPIQPVPAAGDAEATGDAATIGDDAQLANVDMQNWLEKQQRTMWMMSNISKAAHDTAMAIIRKMGG